MCDQWLRHLHRLGGSRDTLNFASTVSTVTLFPLQAHPLRLDHIRTRSKAWECVFRV